MEELIKNILGIRQQQDPPLPKGTKTVSYKDITSPQAKFDRAVEAMKQKGWQVQGDDKKEGVLGSAVQALKNTMQSHAQEPVPSPTLAPGADDFEKTALPILNEYSIPPNVAFGMAQAEGGKIGDYNKFNINAVDSNPQAANNYGSQEEAVRAFAELIAKNPRYQQAYSLRSDPEAMLKAIQDAGYAGDPKTWRQRSIKTGGAGQTYKSYADFVRDTPNFRRYSD